MLRLHNIASLLLIATHMVACTVAATAVAYVGMSTAVVANPVSFVESQFLQSLAVCGDVDTSRFSIISYYPSANSSLLICEFAVIDGANISQISSVALAARLLITLTSCSSGTVTFESVIVDPNVTLVVSNESSVDSLYGATDRDPGDAPIIVMFTMLTLWLSLVVVLSASYCVNRWGGRQLEYRTGPFPLHLRQKVVCWLHHDDAAGCSRIDPFDKHVQLFAIGDNHIIFTSPEGLFVFGGNQWGQLGLATTSMWVCETAKRMGLQDDDNTNIPSFSFFELSHNIQDPSSASSHQRIDAEFERFTFHTVGNGRWVCDAVRNFFFDDVVVSGIACGTMHSVFLIDNGASVWVCGSGSRGQLGPTDRFLAKFPNAVVPFPVPLDISTVVPLDCKIATVSCGAYHTVLLCGNGDVVVFGCGLDGQLLEIERGTPHEAPPIKLNFASILSKALKSICENDARSREEKGVVTRADGLNWRTIMMSKDGDIIWNEKAASAFRVICAEACRSSSCIVVSDTSFCVEVLSSGNDVQSRRKFVLLSDLNDHVTVEDTSDDGTLLGYVPFDGVRHEVHFDDRDSGGVLRITECHGVSCESQFLSHLNIPFKPSVVRFLKIPASFHEWIVCVE